jgi:hypothetical protein
MKIVLSMTVEENAKDKEKQIDSPQNQNQIK